MDEYWLHYVGKGLYSIDKFEKETKRFGVQRAIPFYMLKKFQWGDIILLAHWVKTEDNKGQAEVFGYFIVNSITHNLPKDINKELLEKLDVVSIASPGTKYENRACGGYFLGSITYVKDNPDDIEAKTKEVCKEMEINPNNFKWFLRGPYRPLKRTILLKPAKFSRGYFKVSIEKFSPDTLRETEPGSLIWIYNYKQRTYLRKRDLHSLGTEPLDNFL